LVLEVVQAPPVVTPHCRAVLAAQSTPRVAVALPLLTALRQAVVLVVVVERMLTARAAVAVTAKPVLLAVLVKVAMAVTEIRTP
jgi:hypothetical protein